MTRRAQLPVVALGNVARLGARDPAMSDVL
jgi:hypothetical protein